MSNKTKPVSVCFVSDALLFVCPCMCGLRALVDEPGNIPIWQASLVLLGFSLCLHI